MNIPLVKVHCVECGNEVECKILRDEIELNRKEIMIAFKRLVDVENRIEAIGNKLRG